VSGEICDVISAISESALFSCDETDAGRTDYNSFEAGIDGDAAGLDGGPQLSAARWDVESFTRRMLRPSTSLV
jgi:hypothetical protein